MSLISRRKELLEELYAWRYKGDRSHWNRWIKEQALDDAIDWAGDLKADLEIARRPVEEP